MPQLTETAVLIAGTSADGKFRRFARDTWTNLPQSCTSRVVAPDRTAKPIASFQTYFRYTDA
jgi:hypothetical protein